MNILPAPSPGEIIVLLSPPHEALLSLTAALALNGPLLTLDAGNQFDAYELARLIRRRSPELYPALERTHVSRAFTCYQVVALFEQLPPALMPHVVLDLLATFYDESVTPGESYRLLRIALSHARRVSQVVPVVISVRPPATRRVELLAAVIATADRLLSWEMPAAPPRLHLFS